MVERRSAGLISISVVVVVLVVALLVVLAAAAAVMVETQEHAQQKKSNNASTCLDACLYINNNASRYYKTSITLEGIQEHYQTRD